MKEEWRIRGDFSFKDESEGSAIIQDYIEAIDYFDELYTWAKELGQKDRITTDEFGEIEEALKIGGTALERSAELSMRSTADYYSEPRDDLIKRVYEVLQIRREFMHDPKQITMGEILKDE